jgi:hypothetical protein
LQPFKLDKAAPASAAEDIFRNFLFFIGLPSLSRYLNQTNNIGAQDQPRGRGEHVDGYHD